MKIEELKELLKTQRGRLKLIQLGHIADELNYQSKFTPLSIVRDMVNTASGLEKNILILFNLEFLEVLVKERKVDPKRIFFLGDNDDELLFAQKFYGVNGAVATKADYDNKTFMERISTMQFDLVFSNPPYNGNVDLKILKELVPIAKELVIVHPSTWLIDLKGKSKLYNDFKKMIGSRLKRVKLFNGNPIFNIGLFVPCAITHINGDNNGTIEVENFEEKFSVSSIDDITKFGKAWEPIVKPFMLKIVSFVQQNGSLSDHDMKANQSTMAFPVQLAAIRGHVDITTDTMKIVKDDFYTMVMDNPEKNKGIRSTTDSIPTFEFATEYEQNNFLTYCQTDFARFCLALLKNNANMHRGEMELIPWFDFTQSWDDAKLFAHFGINEETQEYIRNFLPDYHGIRK